MKKVVSIILTVLMLVSMVAVTGCSETKAEELKLGMGVVAAYGSSTSADGETNGKTETDATVAAVLLDAEGKIIQCVIDAVQCKASYTSTGLAVAETDLRTKMELGTDYGMSAYGTDLNNDGVVKEWNEQVEAFISAIKGKTMDEVSAMVVEGYGNDDITTAGCTIAVTDFVSALEKAVANVKATTATSDDTLQLGVVTTQSTTDATEEKDGTNEMDTAFTAAVVDADGKVVVAVSDMLQANVSFNTTGACTTDITTAPSTKLEQGDNYGMAAYGSDLNEDGVVKEWYDQAAAFDAALVGLTADGIAALESNGYGVESLQTAGCTVAISDMVKAAVKAATVA